MRGEVTSTVDLLKIKGDRPAARIQVAFERAAQKRPRDFDDEVAVVWCTTNKERARIGKGQVSLQAVQDVERMALGHIDYNRKLGFYCEKLVQQKD